MSKNLSDKDRMRDTASKKENPKFVSDADIIGRSDWLKQGTGSRLRSKGVNQKEVKFVSDEDIVRRAS